MVNGKELVKILNNCKHIKGYKTTRKYCYGCPMAVGEFEEPCKDLIPWWTKEADLNLKKLREEKKCTY